MDTACDKVGRCISTSLLHPRCPVSTSAFPAVEHTNRAHFLVGLSSSFLVYHWYLRLIERILYHCSTLFFLVCTNQILRPALWTRCQFVSQFQRTLCVPTPIHSLTGSSRDAQPTNPAHCAVLQACYVGQLLMRLWSAVNLPSQGARRVGNVRNLTVHSVANFKGEQHMECARDIVLFLHEGVFSDKARVGPGS